MVDLGIELYTSMLEICLPIAIVFEISNMLIGMLLRAAFGGKLWLGR